MRLIDEVGTDKARPACDKDFHGSEGIIELRESRMQDVAGADFGLGAGRHGPLEAEAVPEDAAIGFGGVDGVGFVDEAGVVFQAEEAVGEANRNVHDVTVGGGKLERGGLAEGRGILPQIEQNIEHATGDAVNELLVGVRRDLEVHAAQDSGGGGGEEFLADLDGDAMGGELAFMEGFDEISAGVFEDEGPEDFDAGQGFVDQFHEVTRRGIRRLFLRRSRGWF